MKCKFCLLGLPQLTTGTLKTTAMGDCIYCGRKAGLFKHKHRNCEIDHHAGMRDIINNISSAIPKTSNFESLENNINEIAGQYWIKSHELSRLYTRGFVNAVETVLDDGILTAEEEANFKEFKSYFHICKEMVDINDSLKKASVLREIIQGKIPECEFKIPGFFPFRFLNTEYIIWVFYKAGFYEQHTDINWKRDQGEHMKINCGIYHRSRTFKGYHINEAELKHMGHGTLTLTNKQIYFSSSFRNFSIPYKKIAAVDSYEDAVGISIERMNAKPQVFKDLDGWFIYNLITNLHQNL